MQEILPGVFLGPSCAARNLLNANTHGISLVILTTIPETSAFLRSSTQEKLQNSIVCKEVITEGDFLLDQVDTMNSLLQEEEEQGGKVLVACDDGNNLSAAFVVAYVMQAKTWPFTKARAWVLRRRYSIDLSVYQSQLLQYETFLCVQLNDEQRNESLDHRRLSEPDLVIANRETTTRYRPVLDKTLLATATPEDAVADVNVIFE